MSEDRRINEDEIIKKKLDIDEGQLKRALRRFITFSNLKSDPKDIKVLESNYKMCLMELGIYEQAILKKKLANKANIADSNVYTQEIIAIEKRINDAKESIEDLKKKLQKERENQNYKLKFESVGKIISQLPSRTESLENIARVKRQIENLKDEEKFLDEKTSKRRKQFQVFFQATCDLQNTLAEEEENERKRKERELEKERERELMELEKQREKERERERERRERESLLKEKGRGLAADQEHDNEMMIDVVPQDHLDKDFEVENEGDQEDVRRGRGFENEEKDASQKEDDESKMLMSHDLKENGELKEKQKEEAEEGEAIEDSQT